VSAAEFPSSDAVGYIQHHLVNLAVGDGFWTFNIDTLFFGASLAGLMMYGSWWLGRNLNPDTPSGFQNVIESVVEFVDQQVRDLFPGVNPLVGPLALTIFVWVWLMNLMDLIPVDLLPMLASKVGIEHLKVVPTTDLGTTFALSLSVFTLIVYYHIRIKGLSGYVKMFLFHPFGKYAVPFNIIMTTVEEIAKPLSLALRLFGNLFAGELLFMLIALMSFAWYVLPVQVLLGSAWAIFHVLIVALQAFIFMLLTIVYLALASMEVEEH
jgi:F-type H+-transporting ATPase subunit a